MNIRGESVEFRGLYAKSDNIEKQFLCINMPALISSFACFIRKLVYSASIKAAKTILNML